MNKQKYEEIFYKAGVKPIAREKIEGYDLYIGEGFSMMPHSSLRRFEIKPLDFPHGVYVTWWLIGHDDKIDTGQPVFFDAMHNPEYSVDSKQGARINSVIKAAKNFIKYRKRNVTKH